MKNLTQDKFRSLPLHQQTEIYFSENQVKNKRGQSGPSVIAQSKFINNWQLAFNQFADSLPNY